MKNNFSRKYCKEICKKMGWKKEPMRNVVFYGGEKWSFSLHGKIPECRQTYEDTVGFIGTDLNGTMRKYRVKDYNNYSVSRISPSGLKAYNVKTVESEMEEL